MRARIILLVSLVLNAALGTALITWLVAAPKNIPRVVRPINTAAFAATNIQILKTNVLVRPRTFTWQEVESPDYAVYVANLRALGMPESTVRDIIVADIDQIFVRRRHDEAAKQDFEWWRSTPSREARTNALDRAQSLEEERRALITKLLGPDWDQDHPEPDAAPLVLAGPVLGALPDDVKARVQSIAGRSMTRVRDYLGQKESTGETPSAAELVRLRDETRQQLATVLSAAQLEEFLLRYSDNASRLRYELDGFNATPEEFRTVFRATDALDRDLQLRASGDDAAARNQRAALEQQRLAAIKAAIGPQRFEAYQMARDPAYQEAVATAREVGGGPEVAQALYEIKRVAAEKLDRIRNDPALTDAQKQQQLRETELEQMHVRAAALGETPPPEPQAATAPPAPVPFPTHVVTVGDSLWQLTARYNVGIRALREANPGVDIYRALPGTVLNIPQPEPRPPLPYPPGRR